MSQLKSRGGIKLRVPNGDGNLSAMPLIFLHGYGSSSRSLWRQFELLKNHFYPIRIDFSPNEIDEFDKGSMLDEPFYFFLEEIESFLKSSELKKPRGIIAHSFLGTSLALKLCEKEENNIDFLILLNPGNLIIDNAVKFMFWNMIPQTSRILFINNSLLDYDRLIDKTVKFVKNTLMLRVNGDDSADLFDEDALRTIFKRFIGEPIVPKNISCPVLIVAGELDSFAPIFMAKELNRIIPYAELHVVSMAGHDGPLTRFNDYNGLISQFLKKNGFM